MNKEETGSAFAPATGSPTRFSPEVVKAALECEQYGFDEFCRAGELNAIRKMGETEESCALRVIAAELRRVQDDIEWLTCLTETIRDKGEIRMGKERGIMAWASLRDLAKRRLALRRESENEVAERRAQGKDTK